MEEGQNLFDFLSAMIPIKVPLTFETPHLNPPNENERHVLSVIRGIPIGLYTPGTMCFSSFSSSVYFFLPCLPCLPCSHWWLPESTNSHVAFLVGPSIGARPLTGLIALA